ncbi:MAG: ECF transporter S component [Clostridia bacterium]|nr:ECF transporter S component [Clostridia bacterium]
MTDYAKLWETVKGNVTFIVISVLIIAAVYLAAFGLEKLIEKKCNMRFNSERTKVNRLVVIALFSALSAVLMFFEFPVWFAPSFYELDFSEIPALVGAFMFGPTAGVAIEGIKILLKIVLKGTTTAFVGDFANFIIGCAMVVPASAVYFTKKSRKSALVGMITGGLFMTLAGSFMNGFYLLPKFSELFGLPMETIIAMGHKVNGSINSVFSLVALAVVPFNILKSVIVAVITLVLYKYISNLIKGQHISVKNS